MSVVSVVTPVFNGAPFIAECIESVQAQTYDAYEYVISDNHSTDETRAIVERYARDDPRIRVVGPERFLEQIEHWNGALRHVSTECEYVKIVCADDTIAPTCLERMVAVAEAHPSAGMIGSLRYYGDDGVIDQDGVPPNVDVVPGRWLMRQQLLGGRYTTGPPSSLLYRMASLPTGAGPFDEGYVHSDDELSYRMLLHSDFGYVAEPLTYTRLHPGSQTAWGARVGTWLPDQIRMVLEHGPAVLTAPELDKVLARWVGAYTRTLEKWTINAKLLRNRDVARHHRRVLAEIEHAAHRAGREMPLALRTYKRLLERPNRLGSAAPADEEHRSGGRAVLKK